MLSINGSKRKEQKALLKELESIKSLLDNGELMDDDFSCLAETAKRKSMDDLQPNNQHTESLLNGEEDHLPINNDTNIDLTMGNTEASPEAASTGGIPILEEVIPVREEPPTLAPNALPGQQPLFTETKQKESSEPKQNKQLGQAIAPIEKKKEVEKKKEKADITPQLKTAPSNTIAKTSPSAVNKISSSENPFLPKHIRERLTGNIDKSIEVSLYPSPPKTAPIKNSEHPRKPSPSDSLTLTGKGRQQEIVNSLVEEFMPKIEARLREKLKELLDVKNQT